MIGWLLVIQKTATSFCRRLRAGALSQCQFKHPGAGGAVGVGGAEELRQKRREEEASAANGRERAVVGTSASSDRRSARQGRRALVGKLNAHASGLAGGPVDDR